MKDFIDLISTYETERSRSDQARHKMAIGTLIGIKDSSFRRTGLRILIMDGGEWRIGKRKGIFEGSLLQKIQAVFQNDQALTIAIDTASQEGQEIGVNLGYRGIIHFLISPISVQKHGHPINILSTCLSDFNYKILITITEAIGFDNINKGDFFPYKNKEGLSRLFSDFDLINAIDEGTKQCWDRGRLLLQRIELANGTIEAFYEILTHPPKIVLFGDQYDIYPLVTIAKSIGWRVAIVANVDKIRNHIKGKVDNLIPVEEIEQIEIDSFTAFILMSHDFEQDMKNLIRATKTDVPYIGMLGPRRRFSRMYDRLSQQNFQLSKQDKMRVHAPMGLDIGAATQEEMAISLIAEIRAFFNNCKGGFLKDKNGNIHHRE